MIEQIINPKHAYEIGRDAADEKFSNLSVDISRIIVISPFYCANAGMIWPSERAIHISRYLGQGVSKDPQFCYEAGCCWDDLLFDLTESSIISGLEGSLIYQLRSLKDWTPERSEKVRNLMTKDILKFYDSISDYHDEFVEFAENLGVPVLMNLSVDEFYKSAEAYKLLLAYDRTIDDATLTGNIQRKVEVKELFFRNLKSAIEENKVSEYAQSISSTYSENMLARHGLSPAILN